MDELIVVLFGFFLGAMPFSMVLTKWIKKVDVRNFGDGNPGALNAFKAGGWGVGLAALIFDFFKGFFPAFSVINYFHFSQGWTILIAVSPILGHAYSPFLGFKGGKAIATSFGTWTGLTVYQAPLILGGFCTIFLLLLQSSVWATILAFTGFLIVFPFLSQSPTLVWISLINFFIILQKHFRELSWPIQFRER